eukprot:TRINITY_DN2556_c0_g1_i1.p1 TRINITY_DN2556_c0_g1~~TRINITY_DN2556_c0_g1_i1.p1  ORF type:complete len:251 (-),score=48.67 TRINITY_DN2556_c0_g1_i1:24-776(-)
MRECTYAVYTLVVGVALVGVGVAAVVGSPSSSSLEQQVAAARAELGRRTHALQERRARFSHEHSNDLTRVEAEALDRAYAYSFAKKFEELRVKQREAWTALWAKYNATYHALVETLPSSSVPWDPLPPATPPHRRNRPSVDSTQKEGQIASISAPTSKEEDPSEDDIDWIAASMEDDASDPVALASDIMRERDAALANHRVSTERGERVLDAVARDALLHHDPMSRAEEAEKRAWQRVTAETVQYTKPMI